MSDNTQTENNAADDNSIETLQDIEKRYFSPDEVLTLGVNYFNAVQDVAETIASNFDVDSEEGFPEGFGLAIIPISERQDGKNVVTSVVAAAVPTLAQIQATDGGTAFIDEMLQNALMTKVANAARPKDGQVGAPVLPKSVADFMEGARRESLKGYQAVAMIFVKKMKKKGMKTLTPVQLRECLQSAATANQYYPNVSQTFWEKLANGIIQLGEKKKLDMQPVKHWLETRDEASARVVDDDMLAGILDDVA